jgi:hypothetical protein
VAPHATVDVTFDVPAGRTWAIFVNPGPDRGPLITAADVPPGVVGRLPITIGIGPNGEPWAQGPPGGEAPGWFGE